MKRNIIAVLLLIFMPIAIFAASKTTYYYEKQVISFTDALGRKATIEGPYERILPGNNEAQLYLYALAPDKMAGLASPWPADYSKDFYKEALVLSQYGSFNPEDEEYIQQVKSADFDLILLVDHIPDSTEDLIERLDAFERENGVEIAYFSSSFNHIPNTIRWLGTVLQEYHRGRVAASYATKLMAPVKEPRMIQSYYYSRFSDALSPVLTGTKENEVLAYMGLMNVADENMVITPEKLRELNPDFIILSQESAYNLVTTDPAWQAIPAVLENRVLLVPKLPYDLLSEPDSIQRLLGLQWLRYKIYGTYSEDDLEDKAEDFFEKIFPLDISDETIEDVLEK